MPTPAQAARPSNEGGAAKTTGKEDPTDRGPEAPPPLLEGEATETARLLSEFAKVLNRHGPDSPESEEFLHRHGENPEFSELARLSVTLKRALSMGRPSKRPTSEATTS